MASHIIPRRIQYIIQFIYDYRFPSKSAIIKFIEEKDFKVSARTLERDIERIRSDYGLEIVYNKTENGYYIDEEKSVKVQSFFKFLEIVSIADIFSESLQNSHKILEFVSFDDSKNFKGIQNLKEILIAISQNKKLHFTHENFSTNALKEYTIAPFLLKEYENRWYVIGVPENMEEIRTFGVDRLNNVTIGKSSKLKKKNFQKQLDKFNDIIGLYFDNGEPQKIKILVDALHIKYMNTLPLHHSQMIHPIDKNGKHQVDFFLIPNYEFITQILKIGSEVEVIYPLALRGEIKKILKASLNKYN
ncbi:MAG: helix-turn-helix transcriptional regulator [Lutibacter sp.]